MTSVIDTVHAKLEDVYPTLIAGVGFLTVVIAGPRGFSYMISHEWQIGNIYSSAFDVASIFTAFLFTIYTFIVTTDRGFIGRSKGTKPYTDAVRYTLRAGIAGGLLTLASIPMMIAEPTPIERNVALVVVALWSALGLGAAASFARAAHLFSIFIRQHQ